MRGLWTILIGLALVACSSTDMSGLGSASSKKDKSGGDDDGGDDGATDDTGDGDTDGNTDSDDSADGDIGAEDGKADPGDIGEDSDTGFPDEDGDIITEDAGDPAKCWFMVSGGHFGWSSTAGESYGSTWPKPIGGGAITHGAKFDTVGGVFLNMRKDPFEYKKGGGEIDGAIDATFDSIAVAPGMKVEIKDASGTSMYKGKGPYIALSNNYDHISNYPALSDKYRAREADMEPWMKEKFTELNYVLPRLNLHAARWVKVSKLKGVPCE